MSRPARRVALLSLTAWLAGWAVGCGGAPTHGHDDDVPELVGVWYTVESGDSVTAIARRHGVPAEDIVELNGLVDPDQLEVGQDLFLYGIDELLSRKRAAGALAAKPKAAKPKTASRPAAKAGTKPKSTKGSGKGSGKGGRFVWPLDTGTLTSGYGRRGRRLHKGIDLAAAVGTPIKAVADGKVIYSDNKQRGYGNLVILEHADDFVTVYAHNRRNLVDEGETVRQGAVIAELGNTGRSTGPHLHFEIRLDSKAVDPLIYLPAR